MMKCLMLGAGNVAELVGVQEVLGSVHFTVKKRKKKAWCWKKNAWV
jgi:hypothetical protein